MSRGPKKPFTIRLTYFKPTGKLYATAEEEWDCNTLPDDPSLPYMEDVFAKVRGLRASGGQGALPGLSLYSEGWDGFILVECDQGLPRLLLPEAADVVYQM